MNTCRSCGQLTAVVEKVMTGVGPVTVTQCMACDRARCGSCNKPVPGNARSCPSCGHVIPMLAPG